MPSAKFLKPKHLLTFDDAMRRLAKLPPLPSGKKAQRKIWRKKKNRKG
jgi:hypothetical protein